MYDYLVIIGWILYGLLQKLLVWIPILKPAKQSRYSPPSWWYSCNTFSQWYNNIDADGYPNDTWCDLWVGCAFRHLVSRIVAEAQGLVTLATTALRALLGALPSAYASFSAWVAFLVKLVGSNLPSWASSAIDGLWRLWNMLPLEVRLGVLSWSSLFLDATNKAIAWALDRYELARVRATLVYNWLLGAGQYIESWWRARYPWLDDFANNAAVRVKQWLGTAWAFLVWFAADPRGAVLGYLGVTWTRLVSWSNGPLDFYYNLWGRYQVIISAFFADPLAFIADRLEAAIEDRW